MRNKSKVKTSIPIVLIIFSLIFLTGCNEISDLLGQGENNPDGTYTVVFKITDREVGNDISVARVGWKLIDGDVTIYHSNSQGKVTITDVEKGQYEFLIDGDLNTKSYDSIQQQVTLSSDILVNVQLSVDTSLCEIIET